MEQDRYRKLKPATKAQREEGLLKMHRGMLALARSTREMATKVDRAKSHLETLKDALASARKSESDLREEILDVDAAAKAYVLNDGTLTAEAPDKQGSLPLDGTDETPAA